MYKLNVKKMQNMLITKKGYIRSRLSPSAFILTAASSEGKQKQLVLHPTKGWRIK